MSKGQYTKQRDEPLNPKQVEYVIYVRKSTDPKSGKQEQSLGDQISACIDYAEREGLKLKLRPNDFSDFETAKDIVIRDTDPDEKNRRVFKKYANLFIIKEQHTGRKGEEAPRPKWRNLIKLVKQGKIKGILSYSTSRLTRNMLEAGEIIDLVTTNKVCLQFTNFRLEDNATGKMMLGFLLVFDNYYSNSLSESVGRGKKEGVGRGKSQGDPKYGYQIIEGRYRKEEPYFTLMQKAFRKKVDERLGDKEIAKWLNSNGMRSASKGKGQVNPNSLHRIWTDSFYYGIYEHGKNSVDLTEADPGFEYMIEKEDFLVLMERHLDRTKTHSIKKKNDTNIELHPIPDEIIVDEQGYRLTHNIPNIGKRIIPGYNKAKVLNPDLTLAEFVKPSQIKYGVKNKLTKHKVEVNYEMIDGELMKVFSRFKPSPEVYKSYTKHMQGEMTIKHEERQKELKRLRLALSESEQNERDYINNKAGLQWGDEVEKAVYSKERKRLGERVDGFKEQIELLESQGKGELLRFEMFIKLLSELALKFKYANYVQKHLIVKYLVSNITVSKQKRIAIALKPGYELLELEPTRDSETRTHDHTTPSRVF